MWTSVWSDAWKISLHPGLLAWSRNIVSGSQQPGRGQHSEEFWTSLHKTISWQDIWEYKFKPRMCSFLFCFVLQISLILWPKRVWAKQISCRGSALLLRSLSYLLLRGDVVIDEGHALIRPLAPNAGDPCHGHLTGFDGRLCAVTAKLCLLLQKQTTH